MAYTSAMRIFSVIMKKPQRIWCLQMSSNASLEKLSEEDLIRSWQLSDYGGIDSLKLAQIRQPLIKASDQVLVKVEAASVNPIDVAITSGYGSKLLNIIRQGSLCQLSSQTEFPITTGRDFAGRVIFKGANVKEFSTGDLVYGFVAPHSNGSHSEEIVVSANQLAQKPEKLSMIEAAAIPYAAMTAWSAIKITGGLGILGVKGKRVLVLGATGGVGSFAIQLLNAWNAEVSATCSKDGIPFVEALKVENIFDYTASDLHAKICQVGRFDLILDCAGLGSEKGIEYLQHLKDYAMAKYVTLTTPLLKNADESGIIPGLVRSAMQIVSQNAGLIHKTSSIRWSYFIPLPYAFQEINNICLHGKLKPCIHGTTAFEDLPSAFKRVRDGHLRGKIVVDMANEQ